MSAIAQARLLEERKNWRKDHPLNFYARPVTKSDGSSDLFSWECGSQAKKVHPNPWSMVFVIIKSSGTDWEGGVYKVLMIFSSEYPAKASFSLIPNTRSHNTDSIYLASILQIFKASFSSQCL